MQVDDPGENQRIMYDLLGVVQHTGSINGGHYIAYVKYPPHNNKHHAETGDQEGAEDNLVKSADSGYGGSGNYYSAKSQHHYHSVQVTGHLESGTASGDCWFYASDSYIELARKDDVKESQAYLLLYVKRH